MNTDTTATGFGRYLQSIRLARKISLEKVSAETRIGLSTLRKIEQEALDELPAEVFLKGFLRSYAKFIDADESEVLSRYEAQREVARQIARFEQAPKRISSGSWLKLLLSLGLLGLVMVASIAVMDYWHRDSGEMPLAEGAAPSSSSHTAETAVDKPLHGQPPIAVHAAGGLVLRVTATDATWLKIIIDQGEASRYLLKSGEELTFEAQSAFSLLVGDAGRIKLQLNDRPIAVAGKEGEIVALTLP
jgi:transcriptional regulator with XRE-family HTH domain